MNYIKAVEILRDLAIECSYPIYLVGGCVRDELLGYTPKDIDLCIAKEAGSEKFIEWLKKNKSGLTSGFTTFPRFGTAKFTLHLPNEDIEVECVIPRTESYLPGSRKPIDVEYASLVEDSFRRDFCCNALYKNIVTGEILDPTGKGREDLKNKILRTPLDPESTFQDDPLRMLRALRFKYLKGFTFVKNLESAIKDYPGYYLLSMERINDELSKMIVTEHAEQYIRDLHKYGLLGHVLPELEKAWGFDQRSKYHSLNLSDHLLAVLNRVSFKGSLELSLAALLHDISKYRYHELTEFGNYTYHGHESSSAIMAEQELSRLRYSLEVQHKVKDLIENHMKLKPFWDKEKKKFSGSQKTVRKLAKIFYSIPHLDDLVEADNMSHAPEYCMPGQVGQFLDEAMRVKLPKDKVGTSLVSGKEIMKFFGLSPGKTIGEIKEIFDEWYTENPNLGKKDLLEKYRQEFIQSAPEFIDVIKYEDSGLPKSMKVSGMDIEVGIPGPYRNIVLPDKIKPYEYPKLWQRFKAMSIASSILHEQVIPTILENISCLPGFQDLSIRLDSGMQDEGVQVKLGWSDE